MSLTEQEVIRRQALAQIRRAQIDPYPSATFEVTHTAQELARHVGNDLETYSAVRIAGRMMSRRIMGNASFAEVQDQTGRIQIYLRRDDIAPGEDKFLYNELFKKLIDLGDFIGVEGHMFLTQTGELTLHVRQFTLLAKTLRPLPVVKEQTDEVTGETTRYDEFADPELRYRRRYVDLVVNPNVREVFVKRSQTIQAIRQFLLDRQYLEVETPILQPIYGGALARPFKTHHNTLDTTLYLRIANELYLKRLIVGGYEGVFEFAKDFRNEGMSRFHNPEFTLLEIYIAYKDYYWMMDLTERMVAYAAIAVTGSPRVQVGDHEIDFSPGWPRMTMYEAIGRTVGEQIDDYDEKALRALATRHGITLEQSDGRGKVIDALFGELVEPFLIQPTFITDYPLEMSPLAKPHRSKPGLVERFEVVCNGKELCNAFSELNDPIDQRARFEEQMRLGERGDDEAMVIDEDFIRALEYGMPPTAGLGMGIDRLVMLLTGQRSIQDVLFFPQMRPEVMAAEEATAQVNEEADLAARLSALDIPEPWSRLMAKVGAPSLEALAEMSLNRIQNQLGSLRKRHKIEAPLPGQEALAEWLGKVRAQTVTPDQPAS